MKALSIQQPWAWAIIKAGKRIENRTWNTNFRGQFFIHSGVKFDHEGHDWLRANTHRIGCWPYGPSILPPGTIENSEFVHGGIVAVATLVDVLPITHAPKDPWAFGPYCFMLEDVRPYPFVPLRGMQGFFETGIKPYLENLPKPDDEESAFES